MARRNNKEPVKGQPSVDPAVGIQLLEDLYSQGETILSARPISKSDHETWKMKASNLLEKSFGENSPNISAIVHASAGQAMLNQSEAYWEAHRTETLEKQLKKLRGLIELLQTEVSLQSDGIVQREDKKYGEGVFLVHGHDDAALQTVARYLGKLGHEPTILREQPNGGRTIIEKFEEYADVGFAVVLVTPDDIGGVVGTDSGNMQPRARQNVIFELGYFIGRLSRNRVCALYWPGVEMLSDYSGVLYLAYDDGGGWRLELAKEMKAAGLSIDMNAAL